LIKFRDIEKFTQEDTLEIDLEKNTIKNITQNKEYIFEMPEDDKFIMQK
jgi:3-isopropylmalate dehydratase small subunit